MEDPIDIEQLAAEEHRSWSNWTRWMLGEINSELGGRNVDARALFEGLPCVKRWKRQMGTLYVDLSKQEKESDRKVVREKLPLYRPDDVSTRGGVSRQG